MTLLIESDIKISNYNILAVNVTKKKEKRKAREKHEANNLMLYHGYYSS